MTNKPIFNFNRNNNKQLKEDYINNFYEYNQIDDNTAMLNVKDTLEKIIGELYDIKNRLGLLDES